MRTIRLIVSLIAIFATSSLSGQAAPTDPIQGLNPGDQIRIQVWRKPEMSGDFMIGADGTITHPLYREIQVTGVPLTTVEERLRTFLTRFETNPQFVIQPLVKVVVAGEVRTPNLFSIPPETTLAQAIVLAGGPTDRGLLSDVRIIRDRQQINVDLSRPDAEAALLKVRSGDQILVGRKSAGFTPYIGPVISSVGTVAAIISIFRHR